MTLKPPTPMSLPRSIAVSPSLPVPSPLSGDREAIIRGAISDLARHAGADQALARGARSLLDTLCWSPDGYPAWVAAELDARGLRSC